MHAILICLEKLHCIYLLHIELRTPILILIHRQTVLLPLKNVCTMLSDLCDMPTDL